MTSEVVKRAYSFRRLSELVPLRDVTFCTYPGFNPTSSALIGPFATFGTCLSPEIVQGTLLFFDTAVAPWDNSFVQLFLKNPAIRDGELTCAVKALSAHGGEWRFVSHEAEQVVGRFADSLADVWTLVATAEFGESWPRQALPAAASGWVGDFAVDGGLAPCWPRFPKVPSLEQMGIKLLAAHEPADDSFARAQIVFRSTQSLISRS